MGRILGTFIGLGFVVFGMMFFKGLQSRGMQMKLGLTNNAFVACSEKPNCVSTMASEEDEQHYIRPVEVKGAVYTVKNMIKVVAAKNELKLEKEGPNYLHYTYKSKLVGFVDDVEFAILNKKVHVRSASRVGYSDLGANRRRVAPILEEVQTMDYADN
jgi:uncharacterized protein (DUF1499 family)